MTRVKVHLKLLYLRCKQFCDDWQDELQRTVMSEYINWNM